MAKSFFDPTKPDEEEYDPYRDPLNWGGALPGSAPTVDRSGSGTPSSATPLPPSAPTMGAMNADMPDMGGGEGGFDPGGGPAAPPTTAAQMNAPYQYPWQQAPSGNPMDIWQFNNLKSTFPDMSDQEVWQHLNYNKAPDSNFMKAIIANIKAARGQQTTTTPTPNTTTTNTTVPPKSGPLNPADFWSAVQGMPVSRGNLQPVVDKLKAVGYADARVTGEDTIFVGGQEWDIVPAGDGSWQLILDSGGSGGGGGGIDFNSLIGQIGSGNQQSNPLREAILSSLQEIIKQNSGGIGDVGSSPQAVANRGANQRASEFQRSSMAERLSAEGLGNTEGQGGSGAFDSEVAGIDQARGEANARYEAELADRMLTQRHDRLMQALQLGAGYLTDEQRLQLQEELQRTQAALDVARMMLQNQQFYDDLYVGG